MNFVFSVVEVFLQFYCLFSIRFGLSFQPQKNNHEGHEELVTMLGSGIPVKQVLSHITGLISNIPLFFLVCFVG